MLELLEAAAYYTWLTETQEKAEDHLAAEKKKGGRKRDHAMAIVTVM